MTTADKLAALDTINLLPTEITKVRLELYEKARWHEAQAAAYWKAYWATMGLVNRPLTAEQVAAREVKVIKPRSSRPPKEHIVRATTSGRVWYEL